MSEQLQTRKRDTNRFMQCRTHADRKNGQQFVCPISEAQFSPDQVCPVTTADWERCQDIVYGPLEWPDPKRESS